eukprot:188908-Rhodomonas_salina.1
MGKRRGAEEWKATSCTNVARYSQFTPCEEPLPRQFSLGLLLKSRQIPRANACGLRCPTDKAAGATRTLGHRVPPIQGPG